ncbi:transposase [Streptomyces sp. NBC_00203]
MDALQADRELDSCPSGTRNLVDLELAPEHRRGHGALYDGLNQGRMDIARLRRALAGMPLPRAADGRIVLAADVSPWLRPDANTCAVRSFCHTFGRGEGMLPMVRAGRTRSGLRWRPAGRRGRRCWTRSVWSLARMSPR